MGILKFSIFRFQFFATVLVPGSTTAPAGTIERPASSRAATAQPAPFSSFLVHQVLPSFSDGPVGRTRLADAVRGVCEVCF